MDDIIGIIDLTNKGIFADSLVPAVNPDAVIYYVEVQAEEYSVSVVDTGYGDLIYFVDVIVEPTVIVSESLEDV